MIPTVAALILVTTAGKIGAEASRPLAQRGTGMRFSKSGLDASIARGDLETNSQDLEALLGRPTTSLANVIGEAPRRYT